MDHLLDNPVFNALCTTDAHLAFGTATAKFFDEEVSPFAGFAVDNRKGFDELHELLPSGRRMLHATIAEVQIPAGWEVKAHVQGIQFLFNTQCEVPYPAIEPRQLHASNVEEMIQLANYTKPGPFSKRTIDFGNYYGIFENGRLAAMTGQRLHVAAYTEISAVCTHPDFQGKGYATALLQHQLQLVLQQGQIPFLHVRADNQRAIEVYERLGFTFRSPMHFYFLQKVKT